MTMGIKKHAPYNISRITIIMKNILQFKSIFSFSTEILFAEKVSEKDLEKFHLMHNDHDVMSTLGGLRNAKETIDDKMGI